jgi:CRP/FNR family transcriptional regulator, cyclic AMP receptor protein
VDGGRRKDRIMQEAELAKRLSDVPFFAGLPDSTRREIARRMVQLTHRAGHSVTEQGGVSNGFHLITDGSAVVVVGGVERATLEPGAGFGEISLIDGQPRSATVIAGPDGLKTAALSPLAFDPLLDDPEVSKALLKVVTARLRTAEVRAAGDE